MIVHLCICLLFPHCSQSHENLFLFLVILVLMTVLLVLLKAPDELGSFSYIRFYQAGLRGEVAPTVLIVIDS